jgi:hypothetical protein
MLFGDRIADSCTKPTDIMNGQNAELFIVKADGSYRYHWVLKGLCKPASLQNETKN